MHHRERNRLRNELKSFLIARSDMRQAGAAADFRVSRGSGDRDRALETAFAICYARPFNKRNKLKPVLDKDEWAPAEPNLRALHHKIIDLRDSVYAHNDKTDARGVEDMGNLGPHWQGWLSGAFQGLPGTPAEHLELARGLRARLRDEVAKRQKELLQGG
jgi:hypothetical protein